MRSWLPCIRMMMARVNFATLRNLLSAAGNVSYVPGSTSQLGPFSRGPSVRYRSASAVAPGVEGEKVPNPDLPWLGPNPFNPG